MKTKTKALLLNIAVAVGIMVWAWFATGCDKWMKPEASFKPAKSTSTLASQGLEGEATINPHLGAPYGPSDLEAWYWKGVRDQAYAQHYEKPLNEVRVEEGRVKLYAPIEVGPAPVDSPHAKIEQTKQDQLDKLDLTDGITVEKKGKK